MPGSGVTPKRPMAPVHVRGTRSRRSRLEARARRISINTSNTSNITRTFACPFYRKDPFQHMDCIKYTLTRLGDVKQHLDRRHLDHFIIRCPICNEAFTSFAERRKHVNSSSSCSNSPTLEFAQFGLERSPHAKLKTRSSRGVAPSEMYYDLWDTLFGKETRPLDPYLGPIFLETIAALRSFWETEKSTIVPDIISERLPLLIVDDQSLSTALINIFDQLQTRFEDRVRTRCASRASQITSSTGLLNKPTASLDVGEPYLERFERYVDPNLGLGIEAFGNQLPNPECPTILVPQLRSQDPAAAAAVNNRSHHVLKPSISSENDVVNENEDHQASGETSIGAFLLGDIGSEFPFDYSDLSNFDCP